MREGVDLAGWVVQLDPGRLAYSSNVYYEVIISLLNPVAAHIAQSINLCRTVAQSVTQPSTVALNQYCFLCHSISVALILGQSYIPLIS